MNEDEKPESSPDDAEKTIGLRLRAVPPTIFGGSLLRPDFLSSQTFQDMQRIREAGERMTATLRQIPMQQKPAWMESLDQIKASHDKIRRSIDEFIAPAQRVAAVMEAERERFIETRSAMERGRLRLPPVPALANVATIEAAAEALVRIPSWARPDSIDVVRRPSWVTATTIGFAGDLPHSVIRDVVDSLHRLRPTTLTFEAALQALESLDDQDAAEVIPAVVEQQANALPMMRQEDAASPLQRWMTQASLSLLVSVITLGWTFYQDLTNDTKERLEAIRAEIHATREANELWQTTLRVDRQANVRLGPGTNSPIIREVYPSEPLILVETEGAWALVKIPDYKSQVIMTGWVYRKFLVPWNSGS